MKDNSTCEFPTMNFVYVGCVDENGYPVYINKPSDIAYEYPPFTKKLKVTRINEKTNSYKNN